MVSRLYGAIVNARNSLYEKGVIKSFSLGVPVLSVGNITVGGTGKTPLVAFVAETLVEAGEKVCILTRGYGRDNPKQRVLVSDSKTVLAEVREAGDEPFELAGKLLGKAFVVADANRAAAGVWAREKFGITAFVLDDAFQHRRVRRDSDIVCVDATNPFGNRKLLPTGILREPLTNLKRADVVVITRANQSENVSELKAEIKKHNSDCRIFVSQNKIFKLINLENFPAEAQSSLTQTGNQPLTAERCLAFCALGNPNNFFEQLRRENYNLVAVKSFPDHHFYTSKDVETLTKEAGQNNAKFLLTTAKDAVKLKNLKFDLPCYVVESELVFDEKDKFRQWLADVGGK